MIEPTFDSVRREKAMNLRRTTASLLSIVLLAVTLRAQEQVDKSDATKRGGVSTKDMTVRVRLSTVTSEAKVFTLSWKRGGQGLGGEVVAGDFPNAEGGLAFEPEAWSRRLPVDEVVGKGGWVFPNIIVAPMLPKKAKAVRVTNVVVEMEFADKGKVFKSFSEDAPKGGTATFAFAGAAADRATFEAELQPLSRYVLARKQRLEKLFSIDDPLPKQFAILGHHGGYGENVGYAIRHNNPEIAANESRIQRLLGFNGMVGKKSLETVDATGLGQEFRRMYFGGPGAGSPMAFFKPKPGQEVVGCPFDPDLHQAMAKQVRAAIAEHKAARAKESWAEWWDEMGVATKEHMQDCPRCREQYEAYLRANGVAAKDVGFAAGAVKPFPLWQVVENKAKKTALSLASAPKSTADSLNYYYTSRFMSFATGQLFPEAAREFDKAGIPLFAMQGPTPSWSGASLDWHEFYDQKANTAIVWETSNRDPRSWQFESYLADIVRGISNRLRLLIGTLIKPHRGAPEQRMLAAISRGATAFEWYTYGPDYARGDSFSQRPDLLERVGKANRFLGKAEERLYQARWAGMPEVAFVSPRSSEIWGKATDLDVTAFENAKWVYLALAHAHIPVDILSEQRLAEGALEQYKAIYVVGPHLRRDAAEQLKRWVQAGGLLWTDALGLSRDEANQPTAAIAGLLPLGERTLEQWGKVEGYRAVDFKPLVEKSSPAHAAIAWDNGKGIARIGREPLASQGAAVLARFGDSKPAAVKQRFGKGEIVVVGWWSGLTYSARVRRPDFDMRVDFDSALRHWITAPALERGVYAPVQPSEATVEAVCLEKDGRRSIALMNWAYKSAVDQAGRPSSVLQSPANLRIRLPGVGELKSVRSLVHGNLRIEGEGRERSVTMPRLDEIDLLILE
jgi:hypothetical protein